MRVLVVHNRYRQPGGEDEVVRRETKLLRDAGHHVVVHETDNPRDPKTTVAALMRSPWNTSSAKRLASFLADQSFDVAHVHNTWFALSPSILHALRERGIPVVVTLHNYRLVCVNAMLYRDGGPCEDCVGKLPWRGVRHRCYNDSLAASGMAAAAVAANRARKTWDRDVDAAIVLTEFARSRLIHGGVPPDKLVVKPPHVTDPGSRAQPPSASRTVLYVGRLSEGKGVSALLDAWSQAALPGLELLIVGEGPLRGDLERRAERGVRFLPWQAPDDVRDLMLGARALVFPSQWYETFGLSAVEALAAGLPVLVSRDTAVAEVVSGGGPPPVPPGDTERWCAALGDLCDNEAVDAWGSWARAHYEQHFTPAQSLERLLAVYDQAIVRARDVSAAP